MSASQILNLLNTKGITDELLEKFQREDSQSTVGGNQQEVKKGRQHGKKENSQVWLERRKAAVMESESGVGQERRAFLSLL
jgi:hypothetical protein